MKSILKRIPGLVALAAFLRSPSRELRNWRGYLAFKRRHGAAFAGNAAGPRRGRLLVVNLSDDLINGVKMESLLTKGMELKGFEPWVLAGRGSWTRRYYRLMGVRRFVDFEDFLARARGRVSAAEVEDVLSRIDSFESLIGREYRGVKIGKYICSSLVRESHAGGVDVRDPAVRESIRKYLYKTMATALAAREVYDHCRPHAALFLERGYTPFGEFFDLALERGLNVIQWCGCHKDDGLMLKRYTRENADQHPASLSAKSWEALKAMPWGPERGEEVKGELFRNYASGSWFSEVGTQFETRPFRREEVQKLLGLDPRKKTAVVFSHLFWDATFFWGEDLFTDYQEWFVESVKAACANKELNWVLKLHPANAVKLSRDGYRGELVEKLAIQKEVGPLPPHVKVLEPRTPVNTYALFDVMDACVTVRGTIGIESAVFGIPVFTAGTGRFDGHGFTLDSSSREDYLGKLSRIHTFPRLTPEQTELAQKFAYGTFLLRPFDLRSLRITYRRDRTATQEIEHTWGRGEGPSRAPDVEAFGEWAASPDEDYLKAAPAAAFPREGGRVPA